jgi:hypothetical protein
MNQENRSSGKDDPHQYQITIQGHLHPRWSEWFENMTIAQLTDGTTTLSGPLSDRAAVYGLINKLRDMGLTLLSVEALGNNAKKLGE